MAQIRVRGFRLPSRDLFTFPYYKEGLVNWLTARYPRDEGKFKGMSCKQLRKVISEVVKKGRYKMTIGEFKERVKRIAEMWVNPIDQARYVGMEIDACLREEAEENKKKLLKKGGFIDG